MLAPLSYIATDILQMSTLKTFALIENSCLQCIDVVIEWAYQGKEEYTMTTTTTETKALTKRQKLLASTVTMTEKGEVNPKKAGTMSYDRYKGYFAALAEAIEKGGDEATFTVADAYRHGVRGDDIRHDQEHGFIVLTPPVEG